MLPFSADGVGHQWLSPDAMCITYIISDPQQECSSKLCIKAQRVVFINVQGFKSKLKQCAYRICHLLNTAHPLCAGGMWTHSYGCVGCFSSCGVKIPDKKQLKAGHFFRHIV